MSFSVTRDLSCAADPVSGSLWTSHCGALLTVQGQIFHFPGKSWDKDAVAPRQNFISNFQLILLFSPEI